MFQKTLQKMVEKILKNEVLESVKKGLGFELYKALLLTYGKRGEKAFRYVYKYNVKKYKDVFVVVGNDEYIVEGFFCTCPDFQIRRKLCAHIIAVEIAKILNRYEEVDVYYVDFQKL